MRIVVQDLTVGPEFEADNSEFRFMRVLSVTAAGLPVTADVVSAKPTGPGRERDYFPINTRTRLRVHPSQSPYTKLQLRTTLACTVTLAMDELDELIMDDGAGAGGASVLIAPNVSHANSSQVAPGALGFVAVPVCADTERVYKVRVSVLSGSPNGVQMKPVQAAGYFTDGQYVAPGEIGILEFAPVGTLGARYISVANPGAVAVTVNITTEVV